jgi:hypothetical protein
MIRQRGNKFGEQTKQAQQFARGEFEFELMK